MSKFKKESKPGGAGNKKGRWAKKELEMQVIIKVSEREAIKQGLNYHGSIVIEYDPANLNQAQREELALSYPADDEGKAFLCANRYDFSSPPDVGRADTEVLRYLLDLRILRRAYEVQERKIKITTTVNDFMNAPIQQLAWQRAKYIASRGQYHILDSLAPEDGDNKCNWYETYKNAFDLPDALWDDYPGFSERIQLVKDEGQSLYNRVAEIEAQQCRDREARAKAEEDQKAARTKAEEDARRTWIAEHGSERLKLMVAGGYGYKKTYESERIEHELPGYVSFPDEYDGHGWLMRANPSLEALLEAKRVADLQLYESVDIVWVSPSACDDDQFEAILVDAEWCPYYIIKRI